MHSRIFQIIEAGNDYDDTRFLAEEDLYEDFLGAHADYVSDVTGEQRFEDIDWFISAENFEKSGSDGFVIPSGHISKYFAKKLDGLKYLVENLVIEDEPHRPHSFHNSDTKKWNFMSDITVAQIEELVDDEYGFWIYDENECVSTFDSWLRNTADENVEYRICGVVDYHF